MTNKEQALFKITGTYGKDISVINASCGKCDKVYPGGELDEKEEKLTNEIYKYRLTYLCPKGHVVIGADV